MLKEKYFKEFQTTALIICFLSRGRLISASVVIAQMTQGKCMRHWCPVVIALASATHFRGIVMEGWDCRCSHLVTQ